MNSLFVFVFLFSHLFWLGDLNYRVSINDLNEVYRRIESADWATLLAHDQLIAEKLKGNAFKYFKEGPIDFPPTYKYQPGTNLYERREDKKKRTPVRDEMKQRYQQQHTNLITDGGQSFGSHFARM